MNKDDYFLVLFSIIGYLFFVGFSFYLFFLIQNSSLGYTMKDFRETISVLSISGLIIPFSSILMILYKKISNRYKLKSLKNYAQK